MELPRGVARPGRDSSASASHQAVRGRGTESNPKNRFDRLHYDADGDSAALDPIWAEPQDTPSRPRTLYMRDPARRALASNQSPDVGFDASLNPYRGCEHGCIYCYARPTHEYLGFSAGLDFETRILVKQDAPELLRRELARPGWKPQVVAISGVTDAYQPIERRLRLTRRCLEVFAAFRNPVSLITKNALVARDADVLAELARHACAQVNLSITTLDPNLQRCMEPRASHPQQRLAAIRRLADAGVPVGVMVGPVLPGLTDHEIPNILAAAAEAGAGFASHIVLRLPHGVKELFEHWLERHYPDRKEKVMNRIRAVRGGRLNDPRFGTRMRGEGLFADQIHQLFSMARKRAALDETAPRLETGAFRNPAEPQMELFG